MMLSEMRQRASVREGKIYGEYRTLVVISFAVTMKHGGCGFEYPEGFEGPDSGSDAGLVDAGCLGAGGGFR